MIDAFRLFLETLRVDGELTVKTNMAVLLSTYKSNPAFYDVYLKHRREGARILEGIVGGL